MKIFAVIRNYPGSGADGGLFGAGGMSWYELPDSSLSHTGNPFFVPDFDSRFVACPSVAYRIGRLGKSIARRFAGRYLDAATMACAVVAADSLAAARRDGNPWTPAVAFDRSCLIGNFQPLDTFISSGPLTLECGETSTGYDPQALTLPVEAVVEAISATCTLKTGDIILAGLSPHGLPLNIQSRLRAWHNKDNTNAIDINIR